MLFYYGRSFRFCKLIVNFITWSDLCFSDRVITFVFQQLKAWFRSPKRRMRGYRWQKHHEGGVCRGQRMPLSSHSFSDLIVVCSGKSSKTPLEVKFIVNIRRCDGDNMLAGIYLLKVYNRNTLNIFHTLFYCFYCKLWAGKCRLGW